MLVQKDAEQLTVIIVNVIWRVFKRSELTDMSDFYTRGSVNQTNKMLREETHHDQGLQLDRSRLGILGEFP